MNWAMREASIGGTAKIQIPALFLFNNVGLGVFQHTKLHNLTMKNAIRRYAFLAFLTSCILLTISSCSNTNDYEIYGSIHGVVTDYSSGDPLENATILLSPGGISKKTDATGYYKFENLESQQYTLTVQKQGYQPNRKTISVVTGEDLQVDIQLATIPE